MDGTKCEDCRYWLRNKPNNAYPETINYGDCRRHSPRLIVASCGVGENPEWSNDWPQTNKDDWCGDGERYYPKQEIVYQERRWRKVRIGLTSGPVTWYQVQEQTDGQRKIKMGRQDKNNTNCT